MQTKETARDVYFFLVRSLEEADCPFVIDVDNYNWDGICRFKTRCRHLGYFVQDVFINNKNYIWIDYNVSDNNTRKNPTIQKKVQTY